VETKNRFLPKQLVILFLLSLVLLGIDLVGGWQFFYRFSQPFFQELEAKIYLIFPRSSFLSSTTGEEKLSNQLNQCQLNLVQLTEENKRARKLLGSGPPIDFQFETVKILGQRQGRFRLSGGRNKNFQPDLPVVWEGGFLGKIVKVNEFDSEAQFVNNSDFRLAVGIWRSEESLAKEIDLVGQGVLKGGKQLVVEEILKDEPVEKNFLVAPLGFPGKFLIGKVIAVSPAATEFKKAVVDWNAANQIFQTVFVIKNLKLP